MSPKLKLAILDMNNGHKNMGLGCIQSIVESYSDNIEYRIFDVRVHNEVPDLKFDIYIASGGPGNPLEGNGIWEQKFKDWLDALWKYNKENTKGRRKHAFFICHSFQLVCHHLNLGDITPRHSKAFGVFPVHKTKHGKEEKMLKDLPDPFYVIDSRDWQLIQPDLKHFQKRGYKILALEKIRTHVDYERAVMAVRFTDELIGTQFHPEANADLMKAHLLKEENKIKVIENFGLKKYKNMLQLLDDPQKIEATEDVILPWFLDNALLQISNL